MEGESDHLIARIIAIVIMLTIIVSSIAFVLETVEPYNRYYPEFFRMLELVAVIIFTIEYFVRFITVRRKLKFIFQPMNIIDLLAILPFYLTLFLPIHLDLRILRILRLVRIFRLLKLARYSVALRVTFQALYDARFAFVALIFGMMMVIVLSSSCVYLAENQQTVHCSQQHCKGIWHANVHSFEEPKCPKCKHRLELPPGATAFRNIVTTFWWSITTITTVGYGDVVPQTPIGRLVAAFTMIAGILCIALPTGVIATTFTDRYHEARAKQQERIAKLTQGSDTTSPTDPSSSPFEEMDDDPVCNCCPHCGKPLP